MKIALCLHGRVGSMTGKTYSGTQDSLEALTISHDNFKQKVIMPDMDIFLHSWSTEFTEQIVNLYNPKKHLIEPQQQFTIPSYIKSSPERAFAHLSRWYSFKKAIDLKTEYEKENNFEYDLVMCQRFDAYWEVPVTFNTLDTSKFYAGDSHLNKQKEWSDIWFIANSHNMNTFATMYDKIYEYMGPEGEFPSSKQWSGISSHFLACFHAGKIGLDTEFKYTLWKDFGIARKKPSDLKN